MGGNVGATRRPVAVLLLRDVRRPRSTAGATVSLPDAMTEVRLRTVDAFTDRPFTGNPAAVVVLDQAPRDDWMAALAREMNLSETAFVIREALPDADFRLRWFTPTMEVDLCGQATLASAHCLLEDGVSSPISSATMPRTKSIVFVFMGPDSPCKARAHVA